jgi:hypothetical protein
MKSHFGKIVCLILGLILVFLFASCRPEPVEPQEAQLIILNPSAGETINSTSVQVKIYVENFVLADKVGQNNQTGEGHVIYYLDVTPPLVKGQTALTAEGSYALSVSKNYSWDNVAPGQHNFWAQLVNNDNTPLEPPAAVRIPVRVVLK